MDRRTVQRVVALDLGGAEVVSVDVGHGVHEGAGVEDGARDGHRVPVRPVPLRVEAAQEERDVEVEAPDGAHPLVERLHLAVLRARLVSQ